MSKEGKESAGLPAASGHFSTSSGSSAASSKTLSGYSSKRLKQARTLVEVDKIYTPEEGLELAKKTATTKFTGTIEVHIKLKIDPKQSDQTVRGQINMPHSTGKVVRVVAFVGEAKEKEAKEAGADVIGGEELIKQISATGKTDFDIAIAEPALMPKLASIAKLLGPRGLMPNPRAGTVAVDIAKAVKEIKAGRVDFKNDDGANVHGILGKADMPTDQLLANLTAFYEAVLRAKPAAVKKEYMGSVTLNATMGPGIRVGM